MATDHTPKYEHPINFAAKLSRVGKREAPFMTLQAASMIRDLYDLAKSLDDLCVCYRLARRPPDKLLDKIKLLKQLRYLAVDPNRNSDESSK